MKTRPAILVVVLVWLLPVAALAHPGHGASEPASWRHYLIEPDHALAFAAVAALAIAWLLYRRIVRGLAGGGPGRR